MKKEVNMRILILGLALVFMLPMGLSLHHALFQHENQVCNAVGEQHVHEYHLSCDHDHYFNSSQALEPGPDFGLIPVIYPHIDGDLEYRIDNDFNPFLFDGRAPPFRTVSC